MSVTWQPVNLSAPMRRSAVGTRKRFCSACAAPGFVLVELVVYAVLATAVAAAQPAEDG